MSKHLVALGLGIAFIATACASSSANRPPQARHDLAKMQQAEQEASRRHTVVYWVNKPRSKANDR